MLNTQIIDAITVHHLPPAVNQKENTAEDLETSLTEKDGTEKKVKQIICGKLGLEETQLKPGISFSDDLGVDSLDVFELIMEIESHFKIKISEEEAEKLRGPEALIEFVKKQIK